jgi:hypothetical protein
LLEESRLMGERGQTARRAEIKASGDFHLTLAAISGNAIMQRFMDELVARSSLVIALYGQSTVSSCGHSEHGDIVSAIEAQGSRPGLPSHGASYRTYRGGPRSAGTQGQGLKEAFEPECR